MKKFICSLLLCLSSYILFAQMLTVKDKISQVPLEGVSVVSVPSYNILHTNKKGQVDISEFSNADSIIIHLMQYNQIRYSYDELFNKKFIVELTESNLSLGEIIVSSNRWTQRKVDIPNRTEVIKMKDIAFQNPQTAADLLGVSGYAFIQKSQLGGGSPMIRGMASNRVLLVVDGVRMNNAIFRSGNLQNVISLDANAMQSAEIIFGPGSVAYGSDAVGGVMNFNTIGAKFSDDSIHKPQVSGNAMTRYSSANSEKTAHVDLNIGLKKLAFVSSITYSNYGDLRSGSRCGTSHFYRSSYVKTTDNTDYMVTNPDSTLQVGSSYSQINFMQKVRYQAQQFLNLECDFHISQTSSYNRYDRLYIIQKSGANKNKLRWAEWYYGPQKWQMHRVSMTYTKSNKLFDNARLLAAYQFFEESRFEREFMSEEKTAQKEQVNAYSLNIDFDKNLSENFSVSYGTEAVFNKVASQASIVNINSNSKNNTVTRYPNGSVWQSYGAFACAKYKPHSNWTVLAGIRYNHFFTQASFDTALFSFPFVHTNLSNGSISGNLGFVYNPTTSWQIYANASRGFRAPNIDDIGKVFESTPGFLVVPNPRLKPETVYNLELGTVKSINNFLTLDITGYYTWIHDAMVRKNFVFNDDTTIEYLGTKSRVQAIQNVTKINVYGLQAGIELFYKGVGLKSNISFQKGREQTADSLVYYPLRHAAPTFGTTHLTYKHRKFQVDFFMQYNARMDFDDLALTERVNASYARDESGNAYAAAWHTFNFKAAYYPNQRYAITLGVENIADRMYRPYSSGINAPGRNFIAAFRTRF